MGEIATCEVCEGEGYFEDPESGACGGRWYRDCWDCDGKGKLSGLTHTRKCLTFYGDKCAPDCQKPQEFSYEEFRERQLLRTRVPEDLKPGILKVISDKLDDSLAVQYFGECGCGDRFKASVRGQSCGDCTIKLAKFVVQQALEGM